MKIKQFKYGGRLIRRTKVEVSVGKLKNGESTGKDEVMREMIGEGALW